MFPNDIKKGKTRAEKDKINFDKKLVAAFEDRNQKINDLKKEILSFLEKRKIDDRDAKTALREALKELKERCEIDKV